MPQCAPAVPTLRPLASGPGWRVTEVTCHAGPQDRPYEERHDWVSIAAVLDGRFTYRSARGRALMAPGSFLLGSVGQCFECGHDHGSGDRCVAFQFEPAVFEDIVSGLRGVRDIAFRAARLPPFGPMLPLFPPARGTERTAGSALCRGPGAGCRRRVRSS
ncbi:MAG TPA: hypothetical protein VFG62_07375 [Rhodopila sp.]|nr:hypothetical protein [Rhodopila sp.]